LCKISF